MRMQTKIGELPNITQQTHDYETKREQDMKS
jgi:hypothetical protein